MREEEAVKQLLATLQYYCYSFPLKYLYELFATQGTKGVLSHIVLQICLYSFQTRKLCSTEVPKIAMTEFNSGI